MKLRVERKDGDVVVIGISQKKQKEGQMGFVQVTATMNGKTWRLFTLGEDGLLFRNLGVPQSLGFQLDKQGRVVEAG